MTTDTARSKAKQLAREIVAMLFVNGQGRGAERLVLFSKEGENLGGWGFESALARVTKILEAGLEERK